MTTYQTTVNTVAESMATLKMSGVDNYFLAKAIGDIAYDYKVSVEQARADVLQQVDTLVDNW